MQKLVIDCRSGSATMAPLSPAEVSDHQERLTKVAEKEIEDKKAKDKRDADLAVVQDAAKTDDVLAAMLRVLGLDKAK